MKKLLIGLGFAILSLAVNAQTSEWKLTQVPAMTNDPVGHIYHTYALGTVIRNGSKSTVPAGLRFVCSVKPGATSPPIVAIFWNGVLMSHTVQEVLIEVPGITKVTERWTHEGSLIHADATNQPALMVAIKQGRLIKFSWSGVDQSRYTVAFELRNFDIAEFNAACKTRL